MSIHPALLCSIALMNMILNTYTFNNVALLAETSYVKAVNVEGLYKK